MVIREERVKQVVENESSSSLTQEKTLFFLFFLNDFLL